MSSSRTQEITSPATDSPRELPAPDNHVVPRGKPESSSARVLPGNTGVNHASQTPVSAFRHRPDCARCFSRDHCGLARLMTMVEAYGQPARLYNQSLDAGGRIYMAGDGHASIYAIKSGSAKSSLISARGEEQVLAFHLPGDVLGLDSVGTGIHSSIATVLEKAVVCVLSDVHLENHVHHVEGGFRWFTDITGRLITQYHNQYSLLSRMPAEIRLSRFLLDESHRYQDRGYSAYTFNLTMTRQDLASFLGLAIETVSRVFTRLQSSRIIEVERRRVTILDRSRLKEVSNVCTNNGASGSEPEQANAGYARGSSAEGLG